MQGNVTGDDCPCRRVGSTPPSKLNSTGQKLQGCVLHFVCMKQETNTHSCCCQEPKEEKRLVTERYHPAEVAVHAAGSSSLCFLLALAAFCAASTGPGHTRLLMAFFLLSMCVGLPSHRWIVAGCFVEVCL